MKMNLFSTTLSRVVLGVVVFIVLAGAGTWTAYDVYVKRSDGPVARFLAPALPAARVGSQTISYAQFLESRDTIKIYFTSSAAAEAGLAGPLTPDVEKNAMDRLVREAADQELAEERGVTLSDDEVRASFTELIASASSTIPDVAAYLHETFQWNEDQFRAKVVRPALLEQKLAAQFVSSTDPMLESAYETYITERIAKPDVKVYLKFAGTTQGASIQ